MRQQNLSRPIVRKVLNGARSRALDQTSSRAFAASSRHHLQYLQGRRAFEDRIVRLFKEPLPLQDWNPEAKK